MGESATGRHGRVCHGDTWGVCHCGDMEESATVETWGVCHGETCGWSINSPDGNTAAVLDECLVTLEWCQTAESSCLLAALNPNVH